MGPYLKGSLRRPTAEHTRANKEEAIAYAMYLACCDQYPHHAAYLRGAMEEFGCDPELASDDLTTPAGIGQRTARTILSARHRDGANQLGDDPRSSGQSGHWLRFAQDVCARDGNGLDEDVKVLFGVAVTAMDAFIASWGSKRYYDSSRPWTLVRHYFSGKTIRGWGGPGVGTIEVLGEDWHPYSPTTFVTPPFPGYTSGHSTVSAACSKMLELMTGSDRFGVVEERRAGALTEAEFECEDMQKVDGVFEAMVGGEKLTCDIAIPIATFSDAADLAGISRVLGGYHIQADNVAGLQLGRDVAKYLFPKLQAYFRGELP